MFELGIDESRYETVRATVERLAAAGRRPEDLRRNYPGSVCRPTWSSQGCTGTRAERFWSEVHPGLTSQGLDPGREFWRALRALGLETFDLLVESEHAQTWITRILAHGGIPVSCLEPFLDLLAREIATGAPDAADLLSGWRTQHTRLTVLHQPTRRFLLYGGETCGRPARPVHGGDAYAGARRRNPERFRGRAAAVLPRRLRQGRAEPP